MTSRLKLTAPYARNRITGGLGSQPLIIEYKEPGHTVNGSSLGLKVGEIETMSDYCVPGYRRRIAAGEVFFNPMRHTRDSYQKTQGYGQSQSKSGYTYDFGEDGFLAYVRLTFGSTADRINAIQLFSMSDVNDMLTEVSTKTLANRGQSEANLWESLAESHQVIAMVRNPVDTFYRTWPRLSARMSAARNLNDAYLIARYGLGPLIRDLSHVALTLQDPLRDLAQDRRRVRSRAQIEQKRSANGTYNYSDGTFLKIATQSSDSLVLRGMALDEVQFGLSHRVGFSMKGLMGLPWELRSWSFVYDWFVNMGDFLYALAGSPGATSLGSCVTVERECITTFTPIQVGPSPGSVLLRPVTGAYESDNWSKWRGPLASPGLVIKQDFRFDQFTRAADAVTLIGQKVFTLLASKGFRDAKRGFLGTFDPLKRDRNGRIRYTE